MSLKIGQSIENTISIIRLVNRIANGLAECFARFVDGKISRKDMQELMNLIEVILTKIGLHSKLSKEQRII